MKEIKKSASFTSKKKGKDVKFNIDLNYSPEYDSFIIKVKEGEGFMAYSSNIERMPLEVIQKLNEMLEEVLIKAGSEYEIKEHKMFDGGKVDSKLTENEVEKIAKETAKALGSKFSVTEGTIDNGSFDLDYDGVKYDGGSYIVLEDGDVKNVAMPKKPIVYNYKTKKKYEFGGDFQSGVYNRGGSIKNERLHVNKDEDYEVRYSKPRPHRKGYKGLRSFDEGGEMDLTDDKRLRVRKPVMPERKLSKREWAEKHNPRAYEFMGKDKMMFGGDFLSNLKNIFTKDVTYKTDENGLFYVILKPLKEQRKYENIEDEVFFKFPENQLNKEDVGDFFVENSNVFLPNAQLSAEEIERKFGVKLSNKAKEIYTDKSKGLEKSKLEELIEQYNIAIKHSNYEKARKLLQEIDSERKSRNFATGGGVGLIGNQKRIDMNKNGKIDAEDFKLLRSSMNGAWRNERKHVNQSDPKQDYEVRYAKPRPKRTGYKGKRNFMSGGKMKKAESGTEVKKGVKGGIMTLAKKIREEGESWQDAVKRAGQQLK